MKKNFVTGFLFGGIICAAITGFAVEYIININPYPIKVNGVEKDIEGYNINDNTYFNLRDVSDAVGGFRVDFVNDTIVLTNVDPTPVPTLKPTPVATKAISELKEGEAIDGIKTEYKDGQWYIYERDIKSKYEGKYDFGTDNNNSEFVGKIIDGKLCPVFENIPQGKAKFTIDLNWYNTVLQSWLVNKGWEKE